MQRVVLRGDIVARNRENLHACKDIGPKYGQPAERRGRVRGPSPRIPLAPFSTHGVAARGNAEKASAPEKCGWRGGPVAGNATRCQTARVIAVTARLLE